MVNVVLLHCFREYQHPAQMASGAHLTAMVDDAAPIAFCIAGAVANLQLLTERMIEMSEFNHFAQKLNQIAQAAFAEYRRAEGAYKKAEEQRNKYPQRRGFVDAEYATKAARAEADFLEASEAMKAAQRTFESHKSEIAALRKELAAALEDHYAVDPAALDGATLELLKSGVLKASEYNKLMSKAQSDGNYTMARMIAKYAGDAAAERGEKYGQNDEQARALRGISYTANQNNGDAYLETFDVMSECYSRCCRNPGLIQHWDALVAPDVEAF